MKKLLIIVIIAAILFSGTVFAGPPEVSTSTEDNAVTVDDIIAVAAQLTEYEEEIEMLAQLVWAEARGVKSRMEQAAVCWVVLNRVDKTGGTIKQIISKKNQFAYRRGLPAKEEYRTLAKDVLTRWLLEKRGVKDVGRVLPPNYIYFAGHGGHNWFRNKFIDGRYWDWCCDDPYEEGDDRIFITEKIS